MVVGLIRSRAALEAEIWALRQQIKVLPSYTTAVRDGGVAHRKRQLGHDTPVPTAGWRCSSRGSAGVFPTEPLAGHHEVATSSASTIGNPPDANHAPCQHTMQASLFLR